MLAMELTYVKWLEGELTACCQTLQDDYEARYMPGELTTCETDVDEDYMSLWQLDTMNGGTMTLADFTTKVKGCFDSARDPFGWGFGCSDYSDTVVEVPSGVGTVAQYPDECLNLLPSIQAARWDLLNFKVDLGDCLTLDMWLDGELVRACGPVTTQVRDMITANMPRYAEELSKQEPILAALFPLKNLNDEEDMSDFRDRLETEFLKLSGRVSADITPPTVPAKCEEGQAALADLNMLIADIERELSFTVYLQTALDGCCDDLLADSITLRDTTVPAKIVNEETWRDALREQNLDCVGGDPSTLQTYIDNTLTPMFELCVAMGDCRVTGRSTIFIQPGAAGCP
jgi:hypothetical protein